MDTVTIEYESSSTSFVVCGAGSTGKDPVGGSVLNLIAENESEELIENVEPYCLPFMTTMMLVNIIEDCLTCLTLMSESCTNHRIQKAMAMMQTLKEAKYSIEHVSITPDDVHYPLNSTENKIKKIFNDRQYMCETLKELYVDLSLNNNFLRLVQANNKLEKYWDYVDRVYDEDSTGKLRVKELKKQMRSQRNVYKKGEYDMLSRIQKIYDNISDNGQVNVYKLAYTGKWQGSRQEQLAKKIENVEGKSNLSIEDYKNKTEEEFRAHSEIDFYYTVSINDTMSEIEKIMEKYDNDIEAIDLKLQIGKSKYSAMYDKRVALEDKIRNQARQIVEWVKFKDEREKARQWTDAMNNSAAIVQAWWRGILLRHGLGPFRPQKKGTASKKKKEKA